jgi:hypothetical protein
MKWCAEVPVAALVVGVVLSACSDGTSLMDPASEQVELGKVAAVMSAGPSEQLRLDALAGALARAAQDVAVRDELIREFGASHAPEGKVLLHKAARSGSVTGQRLAAHFGPVGGLERALEHLPPLDLYMGRESDRAVWPPVGSTIAVVAVVDPDERTATAFYSNGRVEVVGGPEDVQADVLLLIHPTEQTLEDDCDPETAIIPCDDYGYGYGGGDPTFVDQFEVNFGDWWGSSEVEFRADGYCGTSSQAGDEARITGVEPYTLYDDGWTMIPGWSPALCGGNGRVYVSLYETDPYDEDYYGSAWWYANELGAQKSFVFGDPNGWAKVTWS